MVEVLTAGLAGTGRADRPSGGGTPVFLQLIDPQAFGGVSALNQGYRTGESGEFVPRASRLLLTRKETSRLAPGKRGDLRERFQADRRNQARTGSQRCAILPRHLRRCAWCTKGQNVPIGELQIRTSGSMSGDGRHVVGTSSSLLRPQQSFCNAAVADEPLLRRKPHAGHQHELLSHSGVFLGGRPARYRKWFGSRCAMEREPIRIGRRASQNLRANARKTSTHSYRGFRCICRRTR